MVVRGKGGEARVGRFKSAEEAVLVDKGFRRGGILCGSRRGTYLLRSDTYIRCNRVSLTSPVGGFAPGIGA